MFSASERVLYGKRQLIEVICQLRFPTILSISAKEPAEFQEAIRAEFPRYARNLEKLPPKVIGQPGAMKLEEQPTVVNYQFLTAAGDWKVNLTNTFLALATPVYTTWEILPGSSTRCWHSSSPSITRRILSASACATSTAFPAAPSVWRACRSATLFSPPILA